ncbi:MAG: alanine--tRNA ligase, partial [Planctomycetes bacterium]|nr:alanine--tRNA ligase [Planctomycetota bacterium]
AQRERSRAGSRFEAESMLAGIDVADVPETEFIGYGEWEADATVLAVAEDGGGGLAVLLDRTPFYGESGGQVGDAGVLEAEGLRFVVRDTKRCAGRVVHLGDLEGEGRDARGALRPGLVVRARIDARRRAAIQRHHTATHLLHAALRERLGSHVEQKGSLVDPERLRFDFSHAAALAPEDIAEVERRVNEEVLRDTPLDIEFMGREEAIATGAMALFGEKYEEAVRVVRIGSVSAELCGGAHVGRTGEIGMVAIVGEASVAAGIRRIEAVAGLEAVGQARRMRDEIGKLASSLKVPRDAIGERIQTILAELRDLRSGKGRKKAAAERSDEGEGGEEAAAACRIVWRKVPEPDGEGLRLIADRLKTGGGRIVVLAGIGEGRVTLIAALSSDLKGSGIRADEIVRAGAPIVGGGGGGRPELAQAGGKLVERADEALEAMRRKARELAASAAAR